MSVGCPRCCRGNDDRRRYCGGCGENLDPVCRVCGFGNDGCDLFCGGCGKHLVAANAEGKIAAVPAIDGAQGKGVPATPPKPIPASTEKATFGPTEKAAPAAPSGTEAKVPRIVRTDARPPARNGVRISSGAGSEPPPAGAAAQPAAPAPTDPPIARGSALNVAAKSRLSHSEFADLVASVSNPTSPGPSLPEGGAITQDDLDRLFGGNS